MHGTNLLCKLIGTFGINVNMNRDRDNGFVVDGSHGLPFNRSILANSRRQLDYLDVQEDWDDQGEAGYANYN